MELINNNNFLNNNFLSNNFLSNNFFQKKEEQNKQETFNLLKKINNKIIGKIDDDIIKNNNGFIFNNIILDASQGFNNILNSEDIKSLIDGKRLNDKILEKIALTNSLNDTSDLNWYEGKIEINKDDEILKLSDNFCDNILVYFIDEYFLDEKDNMIKAKHITKYQNLINDFFVNFGYDRARDFKTKCVRMEKYNEKKYNDKKLNYIINKEELTIYNNNNNTDLNDEKLLIKQYVKISLSNIDIKKLLLILTDEKNKDYLRRNLIYFYDFDATIDIGGCFNKKEIIDLLLKKDNFFIEDNFNNNRKDDEKDNNDEEDNKDKKDKDKKDKKIKINEIKEIYENEKYLLSPLKKDEGIIIKNNHFVGKHCLTFLYNMGQNKIVRCKIYNKFIDNYECLGISCNIGSNIKNWVYNETDKRLQQTILNGKNYGVLRLETTYKFLPEIEDINNINEMLCDILQEAKQNFNYFYCPVSTMWTNLLKNSIKENLIILNTNERDILYIRSYNKLTEKISGLYLTGKTHKKKLTSNNNIEVFKSNLCKIITYLTFKNLDINIINVIKKYDEKKKLDTIILNLNTYKINIDMNLLSNYIFLVNGKLNFNRLCIKQDDEQNKINKIKSEKKYIDKHNYIHTLEDTGIINYNDFKFMIPYEHEIKNYSCKNLNIIKINSEKILNTISLKSLNKILNNEQDEKTKNLIKLELLEVNKTRQQDFIKKENIKNDLNNEIIRLIKIFRSYTCDKDIKDEYLIKLNDINKDDVFYIIGFKKNIGKDGYILLIEYNNKNYKIFSNNIITSYLNKIINEPKNKNKFTNKLDYNFFIDDDKIDHILKIIKGDKVKSLNGYSYDNLIIKSNNKLFNLTTQEKIINNEKLIIKESDLMIYKNTDMKIKDCKKIEDILLEDNEYYIIKYEIKSHGEKQKYIIDVKDNKNKVYNNIISNEFLEKLLIKLKNDENESLNNTPYIIIKTLKFSSKNICKRRLIDLLINIDDDYIMKLINIKKNNLQDNKEIYNIKKDINNKIQKKENYNKYLINKEKREQFNNKYNNNNYYNNNNNNDEENEEDYNINNESEEDIM